MTAITFPLKKFPGQIRHEDIGFTGRISFLPITILFASLFHLSLALMYKVDFSIVGFSFVPFLFISFVFSVYVIRFQNRDSDYFELSYKNLLETFRKDRKYFNKMFNIGFILFLIVWLISLRLDSIPLLSRLVVNSILLTTFIERVSIEGIYTQKKLFTFLSIMLMFEVSYWGLSESYSSFNTIIAPTIFVFNYLTTRKTESFQPLNLLQKIIS